MTSSNDDCTCTRAAGRWLQARARTLQDDDCMHTCACMLQDDDCKHVQARCRTMTAGTCTHAAGRWLQARVRTLQDDDCSHGTHAAGRWLQARARTLQDDACRHVHAAGRWLHAPALQDDDYRHVHACCRTMTTGTCTLQDVYLNSSRWCTSTRLCRHPWLSAWERTNAYSYWQLFSNKKAQLWRIMIMMFIKIITNMFWKLLPWNIFIHFFIIFVTFN